MFGRRSCLVALPPRYVVMVAGPKLVRDNMGGAVYVEGGVVWLGLQEEEEKLAVWMLLCQPLCGFFGDRSMRAFEEVASVFLVCKIVSYF